MVRRMAFYNCRVFAGSTQLTNTVRLVAAGCVCLLVLWGAAPSPRTVMFLGDSITAGYGLESTQAYPALIQERINAKGWNFKVINAGQSGDTSAGGLSRLDWLLKSRIDVLVLELGANDGLRGLPVDVIRKNLQAIIQRSKERYPDLKVVIAGMKMPPNMGRDYVARFESMFSSLAKENNAALIPFILEGVGGLRELNLPDGIHPTARGHQIVAANVWKVLEPVLRSMMRGSA
ncbi:MAG: arylesterase [Candidatus Binatia bacterium]